MLEISRGFGKIKVQRYKMKYKQILTIILSFALIVGFFSTPSQAKAGVTLDIVFPVLSGANYRNDYGEPRTGGRTHEGNDLMAEKMRPLLAAVDGKISFLTSNEATWGWSLSIIDNSGYEYNYLHLNNDTPGTDDGAGGYNNAFAPGIKLGVSVKKGEANWAPYQFFDKKGIFNEKNSIID